VLHFYMMLIEGTVHSDFNTVLLYHRIAVLASVKKFVLLW